MSIVKSNKVLYCIRNNISDISNEESFAKSMPIILSTSLIDSDFDPLDVFYPNLYFSLILVIFSGLIFLIIWNIFNNRGKIVIKIIGIHLCSIAFLLFVNKSDLINKFGNEIMGSFFEKNRYTSFYQIKLESNNDSIFTVPANIEVENYKEIDNMDPEYSKSFSVKKITVNRAYGVNGKNLSFNNCDLFLNEPDYCTDQFGRVWKIEVTKNKVNVR